MSTSEESEELTLSDFEHDLRTRFDVRTFTIDQAVTYLASAGCQTSRRTLQRKMKDWNIKRLGPNRPAVDEQSQVSLIEKIGHMFHYFRYLNDQQIALRLQENYNLPATAYLVQELRLKNGWRRLRRGQANVEARRVETANVVSTLLEEGTIRQYGRRQLQTHLSRKYGYLATGRDLRLVLRLLDSTTVDSRRRGMKRKRRMNYETRGPNWLWCVDGHDKLQRYGIEIYGCVDAYSRKIIWWYVGLSNRTGISVCRQYLDVVKAVGRCSNFIRSDCGSETTLMASCYYDLY
jgi:hypothetical protein